MPIIQTYIQKLKSILRLVSAQLIFVFIAFAIMVITTYIYVSDIERNFLRHRAEEEITATQSNIVANLLEPEATLSTFSETIRGMILQNYNLETVAEYIRHITNYILANEKLVADATGVYGVFDAYGGQFCTGIDWTPPDDYVPEDRPWYQAAVEANGGIGVTEPYLDVSLDVVTITYARQIFDAEGKPLGIVCLDVMLDRVRSHINNMRAVNDGYGILLDKEFNIIAHPSRAYWGRALRNMNDGRFLEGALRQGQEISEYKWLDYRGAPSVIFFRPLDNGWYLGIVIPTRAYYQSVAKIAFLLSAIGFVMAMALNIVLLRIAVAKTKSDSENQQKSSFLATMSHEIRTPMNAILGIAEMQIHNRTLPKDTSDALNKIYNSSYSLLGIINDILDFSKIEAGKLEILPAKYDVASMIHDTAQLNMMRIGSKQIKFHLEVDPLTPTELFGDELRIKQVLNNLLSNAFKYTESGDVTLSVSAKREDRVKNPHVSFIFRVSDTGLGMSADQIKKLFDEYSRFNMEANRTTEGAGLGMSITKRLVNLMNGTISVESELGKGTTFSVFLPQGAAGSDVLGKEITENLRQFRFSSVSSMKTAQVVREPMPYGRILIVDDVETNLYVAKGLMSPYGLSIETAESGFEAIDKIKAGSVYDVVFMDHMMPKMDGIETTKLIREMGYTHPIVALTANAVAGQADVFLASGFDEFISKPIDVRHLNTVLNKLIRDTQSVEVIEAARKDNQSTPAAAVEEAQLFIAPELAGIFVRDAQKALQTLETMFEKRDTFKKDDIPMYIINTHSMKSALANIGETELSAAALKLELAGREQNISAITAETPAFLKNLRTVIEKISPQEGEDDSTINENLDFLKEKLILFRAACTVYDKKTAKEVLVEIKEKKWLRSTKEMLNALAENLLHSDFEEASRIARDYDFQ